MAKTAASCSVFEQTSRVKYIFSLPSGDVIFIDGNITTKPEAMNIGTLSHRELIWKRLH